MDNELEGESITGYQLRDYLNNLSDDNLKKPVHICLGAHPYKIHTVRPITEDDTDWFQYDEHANALVIFPY